MKRKKSAKGTDEPAVASSKEQRSDASSPSPFSRLPLEISAKILAPDNFDVREFVGLRRICRQWRDAIDCTKSITHTIKRTFEDHPQIQPLHQYLNADFSVSITDTFTIQALRALHQNHKDSKARTQAQLRTALPRDDGPMRHEYRAPDRLACESFCSLVNWSTVKELKFDFSQFDKLIAEYSPADRQRALHQIQVPYMLCESLKKAERLITPGFIDVDPTFISEPLVDFLCAKVDSLVIGSNTDYPPDGHGIMGRIAASPAYCQILRSVEEVKISLGHPHCDDTGQGFSQLFEVIRRNVKIMDVEIMGENYEVDEYVSVEDFDDDDDDEDEVVRPVVQFETLEKLSVLMESPCRPALNVVIFAPTLQEVTLGTHAFDYLFHSHRALIYANVETFAFTGQRQPPSDEDEEARKRKPPTLNVRVLNAIGMWKKLSTVDIRVERYCSWGTQEDDVALLLEVLAKCTDLPLRTVSIKGCVGWDALPLVGLVCSRTQPRRLGDAERKIKPIETLTIKGSLQCESVFDVLQDRVQNCVWTPPLNLGGRSEAFQHLLKLIGLVVPLQEQSMWALPPGA